MYKLSPNTSDWARLLISPNKIQTLKKCVNFDIFDSYKVLKFQNFKQQSTVVLNSVVLKMLKNA